MWLCGVPQVGGFNRSQTQYAYSVAAFALVLLQLAVQIAYKSYRYYGQVERSTVVALGVAEVVVLAFGMCSGKPKRAQGRQKPLGLSCFLHRSHSISFTGAQGVPSCFFLWSRKAEGCAASRLGGLLIEGAQSRAGGHFFCPSALLVLRAVFVACQGSPSTALPSRTSC